MADRNHTPEEQWIRVDGRPSSVSVSVSVTCEACGGVWPCPTRKALIEIASTTRDGLPAWEAALLAEQARKEAG